MELKISIALHIVGLVMWVGGLMIISRFLKLFTTANKPSADVIATVNRMYFGYIVPGFVITLCTGLYQLASRGTALYMAQGWFHGKLTMVVLMIGATVLMFSEIKKVKAGATLSRAKVGALHGVIGLVLIVSVFLTVLGSPFIQ